MSSFHPAPLPPPPPPRAVDKAECSLPAYADRLQAIVADGMTWLISKFKEQSSKDTICAFKRREVTVGASLLVSALGLATLPGRGQVAIVNFWGFAYPASVTIGEVSARAKVDATAKGSSSDEPAARFKEYWVLFGLLSVLDGILQTVTPFYAVAKAGVLWWAASSGRPCGGRPLLKRAFEFIKNNSNDHNLNESLASAEVFVTQIGIPREAFRLALAASSLSTAIVALGVLYWMIISLEGFFHSRPTWIQSNICVLAGCLWPLYATLISRARADAVSTYGTSGGGDKQQHQQLPQQGQSEQHERQGPAAVRWLSYWPTFAFSMVALDPFLGGWVPHYYSVKLLALAFLVMPQTDGAYLIASIALSWDSNTMKSTHERTGIYVPFTPDDGASSLSSAAESVMGEHKESVAVIPTN